MSASLDLHKLTAEDLLKIKKDLTFHSKTRYMRIGGRLRSQPMKPSLMAFAKIGDRMRVPRLYALRNYPEAMIDNNRRLPATINFTKTLLPKQFEPIQECLNLLASSNSVLMALCTGFGKSVCMAYVASQLAGLTLILVDSKVGLKQIPDTFRNFTDAKLWLVGEEVPKEANVIICMTTRIHKIPQDYLMGISTVIIDEAHCFLTEKRYSILMQVEPKYLVLATATPADPAGLWPALDEFVKGCRVERVFERPFHVTIYHTKIKTEIVKMKNGMPNWARLTKDLCENQERNDLIMQIVRDNIIRGFKILILTWREYHTKQLAADIGNLVVNGNKVKAAYFSGSATSYSDSWCLVGTIGKISKAFDEQSACPDFAGMRINLVMLVGSTKNPILLEQMVGRGFRSECPNIIHFVDDNPICKKHLRCVMPWYRDGRRKATVNEVHRLVSGDLTKGVHKGVSNEHKPISVQRSESLESAGIITDFSHLKLEDWKQ